MLCNSAASLIIGDYPTKFAEKHAVQPAVSGAGQKPKQRRLDVDGEVTEGTTSKGRSSTLSNKPPSTLSNKPPSPASISHNFSNRQQLVDKENGPKLASLAILQ